MKLNRKPSSKTSFLITTSFLVCFLCLPIVSTYGQSKQVVVNSYSATITWATDKPCTSQVEYGRNSNYGNITGEGKELVTYHTVVIHNLNPSARYHYRVRSVDAYQNEAVSSNLSFVTLSEPPKDQPPQISDVEAATIVAAGPGPVLISRPSATGKKEIATIELARSDPGSAAHEKTAKEDSQLVKEEASIEKVLIERGGLLLPKGKWQIETSTLYAHTSANRITVLGATVVPVLVVGTISSEDVKRDIFIQSITSRYGLGDNLQIEAVVPFRYQYDRVSVGTTSQDTRATSGLGDIEAGIYRQIKHEGAGWPDLIAGLSVKSNTGKEPYGRSIGIGTGHWAFKSSLVAVKSSDPAIIFANLGYTYVSKRNDIENYGTIKPGNTFDYGLGVAFALNYQLALNIGMEQFITTSMDFNHENVPGSFTNVVNMKYGATWSINKDFSCDITATNGLTEDSPSFSIQVSFPYSF